MSEPQPPRAPDADEAPDIRLGRHALGLLRAARETGDPALIADAEAMALAAGEALAGRLRTERDRGPD